MSEAESEREISPAERYGVESFDLGKKRTIIEISEPIIKRLSNARSDVRSVVPLMLAINEMHFDGNGGRLVSEDDARSMVSDADSEVQEAFETFLAQVKAM